MKYSLLGAVSTLALGAAFGIGTPGAANAALTCTGTTLSGSCTETDTISVSGADFSNIAIPVDYFHNNVTSGPTPGAGVNLTSVSYDFGDTIHAVGTLTNSGSGTASGFFSVSKNNYTFSGGTPSSFLVPTQSGSGPTFHSKTVTLVPGGKSGFSIAKSFTSGTFTPGTAGYSGTGTFNAIASTSTSGGPISTPLDFTANAVTSETAFVSITYNYTTPPPPPPPPSPTPEPASMALLGAGLAGLGAIRRRRKG